MFKILKQEFLFIPLMFILIEIFRQAILHFYPDTALFDLGSELETFLFCVWQITLITSACWFLIRVVAPASFKTLKNFYHNFESRKQEDRETFSFKLFLVFFFGLIFLLSGKANTEPVIRKNLTDTLNSQLHVREATGRNDGIEVEKYLKFVGQTKGAAWCAAYVSYNLHAVGITSAPRNAWAPVFANKKYVVWSHQLIKSHKSQKVQPGDCFTVYHPSANRVGHVGFIIKESQHYFITNEGNTGLSGTREGSGVHSLKRAKNKVYTIANYITPHLKAHEKKSFNNNFSTNSLNANCNTRLPHSESDTISRKNYGNKRDSICSKRLNLLPRYDLSGERRQFSDTSGSKSGPARPNKPAYHFYQFATIRNVSINYQWQTKGELPLQRFGDPREVTRANNTKATKRKAFKGSFKSHLPNSGSPHYPEMG